MPPVKLTLPQQILCSDNMGLVYRWAHKLKGLKKLTFDELTSDGSLGLMSASRFWQGEGKFSTYASLCIKRAMLKAIQASNEPQQEPADDDEGSFMDNHQDGQPPAQEPDEIDSITAPLPEPERKCIEMHFGLNGYQGRTSTFEDIGRLMGQSERWARDTIQSGLMKLRLEQAKQCEGVAA